MSHTKTDAKPLPMADVLRDLALIRASDLNLSALLPASTSSSSSANPTVEQSVNQSYEFVKGARAAIKTRDRGDVDAQGSNVQSVKTKLDALEQGLDADV